MSNFNYTDLTGETLPSLPGCPVDILTNYIRNAAIEFCDKTLIWQYDIPAIDVVANTATYALTAPTGATVAKIVKVTFNGQQELYPVDNDYLVRKYGDWTIQSGGPRYVTQIPPDLTHAILVPNPSDSTVAALKVRVALKPTRASTFFDSNIAESYATDIAHGAISMLASVPGKPYFNPKLAAYSKDCFKEGINKARIRADKALMRTEQRVSFPRI